MRIYEHIEVTSGCIDRTVNNFEVYADKSYIYFNRKHYNIIDGFESKDCTMYKTECIRHNGKRHIKYETTFAVTATMVGYAESLSIEVK